ncbi:MAG: lytic transglycosylase domain-containing protein [Lacrimispora sp.]
MATIDQLNLSALLKTNTGRTSNTAAGTGKGTFRQALNSVLKVPQSLDEMFSEASEKYGVSEKLLKAVAKAESNFNPSATSNKGAAGIMQLMPATARSLGVADPYDAKSNIMGGAKYLRENLEKYQGNVELTLAAYNAGSNNVSKYGGIPPLKRLRNTFERLWDTWEKTRRQEADPPITPPAPGARAAMPIRLHQIIIPTFLRGITAHQTCWKLFKAWRTSLQGQKAEVLYQINRIFFI